MADPTLDGQSLGKLQGISNELNANIIPMPIPAQDSEETLTFDMLGVVRTIALSGIFVGTTSDIVALVNLIEDIVDGDQEDSVPLVTDEIGETIQVKIASISTNWAVDGVGNRCEYRIVCIQGKST